MTTPVRCNYTDEASKREQQILSKQLAAIEHEISVRNATFDDILKNLSLAFDLLEDCGRTYRKANDNIKKAHVPGYI